MFKLITSTIWVLLLHLPPNSLNAGPIPGTDNLSSHQVLEFGGPITIDQTLGTKTDKNGFVDKGDYYFLNTGEKKSFLRKKNLYLIIFDQKKTATSNLQSIIKSQFGNKLDIIKGHSLGKNIMIRVKEGERPEDIVSELIRTYPSINFISPVLSNTARGGELAVIPHIVVSIKKGEHYDHVISQLQDQYGLSLVSKLSFTDTEFELKIKENISDIGRIFEITREIAELPYINWAEPNFLTSHRKLSP